ncbi:hypothetical protein ACFSJQ_00445 [Vibrio olivae]
MTTKKTAPKKNSGKKTSTKTQPKQPTSGPILIQWRFYLILFFVFCAFALLVGRIAYIQIIEPDNLIRQGDLRSVRAKTLHSARGIISDRNDEPLAVSVPVDAVWADPVTIFKQGGLKTLTAGMLSPMF